VFVDHIPSVRQLVNGLGCNGRSVLFFLIYMDGSFVRMTLVLLPSSISSEIGLVRCCHLRPDLAND
jgi:hypothetical protein